jgi:hypothetical protein
VTKCRNRQKYWAIASSDMPRSRRISWESRCETHRAEVADASVLLFSRPQHRSILASTLFRLPLLIAAFLQSCPKSSGRTLVRSLGRRLRLHQERLVRNYAIRNDLRPPRAPQFGSTPAFQVLVFDAVSRRISSVSACRARGKFGKVAPGVVSNASYVVNSLDATNAVLNLTHDLQTCRLLSILQR